MLMSSLNDIMLAAKTTKVLCATVDVPESMLSNMGRRADWGPDTHGSESCQSEQGMQMDW